MKHACETMFNILPPWDRILLKSVLKQANEFPQKQKKNQHTFQKPLQNPTLLNVSNVVSCDHEVNQGTKILNKGRRDIFKQ